MKKLFFILVIMNICSLTYGQTSKDFTKPTIIWDPGSKFGIVDNGNRIDIISGTGKLDHSICGAHITGDVSADGTGEYKYSNVSNDTTTIEYWDGFRMWKPGAILGVDKKGIIVLNGIGKLNYSVCGATITGDVRADGKGRYVYTNISNGTTTSEYWDGLKMWKPGAILGIDRFTNQIVVIKGTLK